MKKKNNNEIIIENNKKLKNVIEIDEYILELCMENKNYLVNRLNFIS